MEHQLEEIHKLAMQMQAVMDPDGSVPNDMAFCEKCTGFRINLLKDEITYYSNYQTRLGRFEDSQQASLSLTDYDVLSQTPATPEADIEPADKREQRMKEQQAQINANVKDLIEQANELKKTHHRQIESINQREKDLIYLQEQIKEARTKSDHYERKITHMKGFSVLNEVFEIEIGQSGGKVNGMELGISQESGDINWTYMNTVFGNIACIFQYLLKVLVIRATVGVLRQQGSDLYRLDRIRTFMSRKPGKSFI